MLLPQEVAARVTLPALRALVARKLLDEHRFSQRRVARALGLTQAAISNYLRSTRGTSMNIDDLPEVQRWVGEIARAIAGGEDTIGVMLRFAAATNQILESRLMCGVHGQLEPDLDVDRCHLCDSHGGGALVRSTDLLKKELN
jgi:predicted transcriptional regulator